MQEYIKLLYIGMVDGAPFVEEAMPVTIGQAIGPME